MCYEMHTRIVIILPSVQAKVQDILNDTESDEEKHFNDYGQKQMIVWFTSPIMFFIDENVTV